jgi:hypothetical protein
VNHFQLNKFSKPDDGYYKRVKVVIIDMVKNALVLPDNYKGTFRTNARLLTAGDYQQPDTSVQYSICPPRDINTSDWAIGAPNYPIASLD